MAYQDVNVSLGFEKERDLGALGRDAADLYNSTDRKNDLYNKNTDTLGNTVGAINDITTTLNDTFGTVLDFMKHKQRGQQYQQSIAETTRRFDKTYFENVRQYDLDLALREYAIREGLELEKAEAQWNRYIQGRITDQDIKMKKLEEEVGQYNFDTQRDRDYAKSQFAEQFSRELARMLKRKV
jgi:hypothetical protein